MKLPTIHLNGSGRSHLQEEYNAALHALRVSLEAMAHSPPNARDYYPQGDNAFAEARAEHEARMRKINELVADYEKIVEHLYE
jgi:hypothetical protein